MTLGMLAFEPKCRSAIPSIVPPLCTEYANLCWDIGLALRLGFATLALGTDLGAADASTTRLLASLSFGPDEGGINAAVLSGGAPACESVGMWDTALTSPSRFCTTFALTSDGSRLRHAKHKLDFGRLGLTLQENTGLPRVATLRLVSEIAGCAIIERKAGRRSGGWNSTPVPKSSHVGYCGAGNLQRHASETDSRIGAN